MKAQIGEYVKLRDGRFGRVSDIDYDREDGDTYFIDKFRSDEKFVARSCNIVAFFDLNEMEVRHESE